VIRVLIVEDSLVVRDFLIHILSSDPEIQVVGVAENGLEAIDLVKKYNPDIITMDIHMPLMDGYEATRRIMETFPTPIVIVSGSTVAKEIDSTFRAIEAGALTLMLRPSGIGHPDYENDAKELIQKVKLLSEIKVVRRTSKKKRKRVSSQSCIKQKPKSVRNIEIAAIGASTGGPLILQNILSGLPHDLSFSILVVQHIAQGFIEGFVKWLSNTSHFPVHTASHEIRPLAGHCYVAPDGYHMEIDADLRIVLSDKAPESGLRPSVTNLFRSVAKFYGPRAVGVLLTGMGRDGADELKLMKEKGAVTIAQDKESSVVFGMPGEAIKINAATYVLSPKGITELLSSLSRK
jgi:two-component system chemotaxis response regulator CheB